MPEALIPNKYSGVLREISAAAAANLGDAVIAGETVRGVPQHLGRLQRKVQLDGYDKESNTVTMAVSSSTPVERYYGTEILSHAKGACNMERLKSGIPLLFNHNTDAHLGRSTEYTDGDPLRVTCRFGGNPLALEKAGDVESGILTDVSIGYVVDEWEIEENAKTGARTYTATKWTLLEVSLVTVPADPTVGVGRASDPAPNVRSFRKVDEDAEDEDQRSADDDEDDDEDPEDDEAERSAETTQADQAPTSETPTLETQRTATMADVEVVASPAEVEATRKSGLEALSRDFPDFFPKETLDNAVRLHVDVKTAQERVFDAFIRSKEQHDVPTIGDGVFGRMSDKERKGYSLRNVYANAVNVRNPGTFSDKGAEAGFEKEVSTELQKEAEQRGITGLGANILIPSAASRAMAAGQTRTLASGGNAGAATNFTTVDADPIELLRSRVFIMQLGARYMTGLHGAIQMSRQNSAGTSSWLLEGGAATSTDPGLDYITMRPNRLSMQNSYYRDLLAQSSLSVDAFLSQDRLAVLARSLNTAAVGGSGTAPVPLGLLNRTGLPAVLAGSSRAANGTVTAGAGGAPFTFVDANNMEAAISMGNGDIGAPAWLTTPKVRSAGRSTLKAPGTSAEFLWPTSGFGADGLAEGPLGYQAICSTNPVLTGFTANSVNNLHAIILGVWSQMLVGDWGLSEVISDNITGAANAKVVITEHGFYDINVRHLEAFSACTSVQPN